MHMPDTAPEMGEYGTALAPGTQNFLTIRPKMIIANPGVHPISHEKRQCFLQSEKKLKYYKNYSYHNCFMECVANYTFLVCHIIRVSKSILIALILFPV